MNERTPRISESEARALWQRAAELQAASERTRLHAGPTAAAHQLTLADVSAAAEGAGIDPDFVRLALAEQRLPDAAAVRRDAWTARMTRRLVSDVDSLHVERRIRAQPRQVHEALRTIAAQPAWAMTLESALGDDPLRDGVLTWRLTGDAAFHSDLDYADARVILVAIRPADDGTLLRLRVPLFRRGINLAIGSGAAGLLGWGGWGGGSALGGAVAGMIGAASAAVLLVPAAVGALAGGTLGLAGYRGLYGTVVRRGTNALQRLVGAVELEAEQSRLDTAPGNDTQ